MARQEVDSVSLYYREGGSDKVYHVKLMEDLSGFTVNFAYGRRGSSLVTGSKTAKAVSYDQARKIFNKLVQEKTAKGYVEDRGGKPFSSTVTEVRDTGCRPQLLNEITEDEVGFYLTHDDWCAQEKFDGRRRLLVIDPDKIVTSTNRKGLSIPTETELQQDMIHFPTGVGKVVLDGEALGDCIMVFDNMHFSEPFTARTEVVSALLADCKYLRRVHTANTTKEKKALYLKLQKDNAEGIVFKRKDSLYVPGRPNSGGDQLKFKFCATATCVVSKTNPTKRSVSVAVYDSDGNKVEVGNVTVYPNQEIPQAGSVVEVRYLYYFAGGSLFQPVLLGNRGDEMTIEDCTYDQLKLKRETV